MPVPDLAVLFFITLYKRYGEYRVAVKTPNGETNGISHKFIIDNFKPYMIKTILWCCIFFVIVPLIIYCLAYIPYLQAPNSQGFKTIIDNQSFNAYLPFKDSAWLRASVLVTLV